MCILPPHMYIKTVACVSNLDKTWILETADLILNMASISEPNRVICVYTWRICA